MLVSELMSHFSSLHVLVIIHSISSLFVSVALKLIFYYWCPCYYSLSVHSYWTSLCWVNYNTLKLDVLSSARLSFIQKVWVQTLWQNTSILLKCPWAYVWISTNLGPAVLLLTLYLDHSAGGEASKQMNTPYHKTIQFNLTEWMWKQWKQCYFICSLQRALTGNYALCSSGNAWGVCSNYCLLLSKAVDSLSSNLGC